MKNPTVSAAELAKHLDLTPRRIQQLVAEGMPRTTRGRYDVASCRAWYVQHLRRAARRQSGAKDSRARIKIIEIETALKELEIGEKTGRLARWSVIESANAAAATMLREALLALPDRLAPTIAAESDPAKVRAMIRVELESAIQGVESLMPRRPA